MYPLSVKFKTDEANLYCQVATAWGLLSVQGPTSRCPMASHMGGLTKILPLLVGRIGQTSFPSRRSSLQFFVLLLMQVSDKTASYRSIYASLLSSSYARSNTFQKGRPVRPRVSTANGMALGCMQLAKSLRTNKTAKSKTHLRSCNVCAAAHEIPQHEADSNAWRRAPLAKIHTNLH